METRNEKRDDCIGIIVDLKDDCYTDAVIRVIMAKYQGMRVFRGGSLPDGPDEYFTLLGSAGGAVLYGPAEDGKRSALAFFRRGERVGSIVERIRDLSGAEQQVAYEAEPAGGAECVAFIASGGGAGTTTLARTIGRLVFRDLGERCLYLSLAPFGQGLAEGNGNVTTRLFYRLMSGGTPDLRRCCREDRGVFVIENHGLNPESASLSPELLEKLRKAAMASGFGYLFLDIGNHLEKDRIGVLKACGRVVSVRREGCGPVKAAGDGRVVEVVTFCSPENESGRTGRRSEGPAVYSSVSIGNMGRMDGANPPQEYCEKARSVMTLLEMKSGQGRTAAGRGKSGSGSL